MSQTVMTFPGKAGDAIHQWPIAYHWARQHEKRFTCWLDERSCALVAPLFAAQPCVEAVEFKPGIEGFQCGGQPFHFDLPTSEYDGRTLYHLGLRGFPGRQLTLECLATANVPAGIGIEELTTDPVFAVPGAPDPLRRLVLHGQGICAHTRATPGFWKFLHRIWPELQERFGLITFVGSPDDREAARNAYPEADSFDDGGSFLELARLMVGATAVIGCGSAPVALAQWLKLPVIRVHDPIGSAPRRIWDGLSPDQLNLPELDLRAAWPAWRDQYLNPEAPCPSTARAVSLSTT